jgi:hypothetical protein
MPIARTAGIINLIRRLMVTIRQKSILLNGTTGVINPGNIVTADMLTRRSIIIIIIIKNTIAAGTIGIINPGDITDPDMSTKGCPTIVNTTIAVLRQERARFIRSP